MAASRGSRSAVLIADEVQHLSTSSSAVGVLWFWVFFSVLTAGVLLVSWGLG